MAKIDIPKVQSNSFAAKKLSEEGLKKRGEAEKKAPREKLKPIIGDDAIVSTKKSVGRKLISAFVKKDVVDVKDYLIFDVLIPNGKRFVLDFIAMTFFGERFDSRGRGYESGGRHDYTSHYRSSYRNSSSSGGRYERASSVDYRNIILRNRRDAEEIVDRLCDRIRDNGDVSVAELLDLLDMPSEYTDNNIGWKDPRDIGIRVVNSGFLLDLAEARYLN